MKKTRNALVALICAAGFLTACGESPTAPAADLPLIHAEGGWKKDGGDTTAQSDTTAADSQKEDGKKGGPRKKSGYILGM